MPLSATEHEEPHSPLPPPASIRPIPTDRVIGKLDEYLNANNYPAAERHLLYWLTEAEAGHDDRGRLTVLNEQIGLYRKCGKQAEGLTAIESALTLLTTLRLESTVTGGTTYVNAATAYKAFGKAEDALPLYQRAKAVYKNLLDENDARLGGLYNNMALTLMALGALADAKALFEQAIEIMSHKEHGEIEMAITYCNLADLAAAMYGTIDGEREIDACLRKAEHLLQTETLPHDGYYAFVCEKCAPTFGYYGHFLVEESLSRQAREIYERA